MELLSLAAAASQVVTVLRGAVDLAKASGKSELMGKLIDLQNAMMELQQRQIELTAENGRLESELRKLKESEDVSKEVFIRHGVYWRKRGEVIDGPFAPASWDYDRQLIRLAAIVWNDEHLKLLDEIKGFAYFIPVAFVTENKIESLMDFVKRAGNV